MKNKLFIYKKKELVNGDFREYTKDNSTVQDYFFDGWTFPTGNQWNHTYITPAPTAAGYGNAIRQRLENYNGKYTMTVEVLSDDVENADGIIYIGVCGRLYALLDGVETTTQPHTYNRTFYFPNTTPATLPFDYFYIIGSGDFFAGNACTHIGVSKVFLTIDSDELYKEVDLYEDIDIPIIYSIADIRDITKQNSNFSKTFDIPNTSRNAKLFDMILNVQDYNSDMEFYKEYDAYLEKDGVKVFDGVFQLQKVVCNDKKEYVYSGQLYSRLTSLVNKLGNNTLVNNDDESLNISFSEYTRTLDRQSFWNMIDSSNLGGVYGRDWAVAPVNKNNLFTVATIPELSPVVAPLTLNIHHVTPFYYDELTPFVFVREIIEKLLNKYGYGYVSEFLDNTNLNDTCYDFTKLVYTNPDEVYETTDDVHVIRRQRTLPGYFGDDAVEVFYDGNVDPTMNYLSTPPLTTYRTIPQAIEDDDKPVGQATTSDGTTPFVFTCNHAGRYGVNVDIPISVDLYYFYRIGGVGSLHPLPNNINQLYTRNGYDYSFKIKLVKEDFNSNKIVLAETVLTDDFVDVSGITNGSKKGWWLTNLTYSGDVIFEVGEKLYIEVEHTYRNAINGSLCWHDDPLVSSSTYFCYTFPHYVFQKSFEGREQVNIKLRSDFVYGGTFDPTSVIRRDEKAIDFLKSINQYFNLYWEDVSNKKNPNPQNSIYSPTFNPLLEADDYYPQNTFRIEPRDLFYKTNTVTEDWTKYVNSESFEFERPDEYLYSRLIFKEKSSDDFFTGDYNEHEYVEGEYGEYIERELLFSSDTEEQKIENSFGQYMCGSYGKVDWTNQSFRSHGVRYNTPLTFQIPNMFKIDETTGLGDSEAKIPVGVFFLNPLSMSNDPYWNGFGLGLFRRNRDILSTIYNYDQNTEVVISSYNRLGKYNYDITAKKWVSVLYGTPNWGYEITNPTQYEQYKALTLYDSFFKNMVDNYRDKNARVVNYEAYIPSTVIQSMRMNSTIIIDSIPYHILEVKDWVDETESCELKLIKIIDSYSDAGNTPIVRSKQSRTTLETTTARVNNININNTLKTQQTKIDELVKTLKVINERLDKLEK